MKLQLYALAVLASLFCAFAMESDELRAMSKIGCSDIFQNSCCICKKEGGDMIWHLQAQGKAHSACIECIDYVEQNILYVIRNMLNRHTFYKQITNAFKQHQEIEKNVLIIKYKMRQDIEEELRPYSIKEFIDENDMFALKAKYNRIGLRILSEHAALLSQKNLEQDGDKDIGNFFPQYQFNPFS